MAALTGLTIMPSLLFKKNRKTEHSSKTEGCAINMAFGHSLPHSEFTKNAFPVDLIS